MKVTKNKVISLTYELEVDDKIADKATAENPLDYIHGTGMLIPGFESGLEGKEPGNSFEFVISPSEGYGEYDINKKFDIPKESFSVDGKIMEELLEVGKTIPMLNSSEQVVYGTVFEVKENTVTMDFNHPMAGKTLHFKGDILDVRDATEKELTEGLHGEYLPKDECCCGNDHEDGECCHGDHRDGECCHGNHKDGHCCKEEEA
jgi:FKBP-type peptidyl-prolyl cis-trans isomerase SlyD